MKTIQLQIEDDVFEEIKSKGIDINNKLKEFIANLADDNYSSISTQDAKKRVSDAVDRYKNGTGNYTSTQEYSIRMNKYTDSLKDKYANN